MTFSCDLKTRSRDESARLPAKLSSLQIWSDRMKWMCSIYSNKSNDRGLLSTARRFNGIYNPSKKTFSCDLKTRSSDESARLLTNEAWLKETPHRSIKTIFVFQRIGIVLVRDYTLFLHTQANIYMRNLKFISLISLIVISLQSCIQIFDEIIVHNDGSGTYNFAVN